MTQGEPVQRSDEAIGLEIEHPGLDREAIAAWPISIGGNAAVRMIHLTRIGSGRKQKFAPGSMPPHHIHKEVRDVTKYDAGIHHQPETPL